MKKVFYVSGLVAMIVMIASFSAYADSYVRVKCDDEDVGAEVYLNGKLVGNCPVDAPVKDGTLHLRARKIVNGDYEKLFEKELRIVDGVIQRIDVIMSAPQLTVEGKRKNAEARRREEAAEARNQLRDAEAGDIEAMKKMIKYYDEGLGVEKSPSKANAWREKSKVAVAQSWYRAAKGGNIDAMRKLADFYDAGYGVEKSPSKASEWREIADASEHQLHATKRARQKEIALSEIHYTEEIDKLYKMGKKDPFLFTSSWVGLPFAVVTDLINAPSKTSEANKIKNEAALRPSTWGKPDSMIARASQKLKTSSPTTEKSLFIVATK